MLTKTVNGKEIVCDADEEAAIRAEWAANDVKPQTIMKIASVDDLQKRIAVLEKKLNISADIGK